MDIPPPKPTSTQGMGLKELQDTIKLLEKKCSAVEDVLLTKEVALVERKAAVEKYGNDFDKFHKELDHLAEQLNTAQPVLTDDDAVKEQIEKAEVVLLNSMVVLLSKNCPKYFTHHQKCHFQKLSRDIFRDKNHFNVIMLVHLT